MHSRYKRKRVGTVISEMKQLLMPASFILSLRANLPFKKKMQILVSSRYFSKDFCFAVKCSGGS